MPRQLVDRHVSPPARNKFGCFPHVSPPGVPSCAIVLNFQASFPVAMSTALIQQPSPVNRAHPLRPCSTLPLIAIDPLVAK